MSKGSNYLVTGETQRVVRYDRTYDLKAGEEISISNKEDAEALTDAGLVTDDWEEVEEKDQPVQYVDPSTGAFIDQDADADSNSYTDPPKEG
jgi:hypothetical protein